MRKFLLIILLAGLAYGQSNIPFIEKTRAIRGSAVDLDGSSEYTSVTPALRLTGDIGVTKTTIAADSSFASNKVYGKWSFTVNKAGDGNAIDVYFINDVTNASSNNGYLFRFGTDEKMYVSSVASGTPTARITSSGTFALSANHLIEIFRNTNGEIDLKVNGTSVGTVTNATYTSSNYCFVDITSGDTVTGLSFNYGEGSLDLNSYERVYLSDDRTMSSNGTWTVVGSATQDTSSAQKKSGTYLKKVVTSGEWSGGQLPYTSFVALKADANGIYEKYTSEVWVYNESADTVQIVVGDKSKKQNVAATTWTKVVYNYQITASTINQPIQILWKTTGKTNYADDVSLTKAWDVLANVWVQSSGSSGSNRAILSKQTGTTAGSSTGLQIRAMSTDVFNIAVYDGASAVTHSGAVDILDGSYKLLSMYWGRINGFVAYINGVGSGLNATATLGKIDATGQSLSVGVL